MINIELFGYNFLSYKVKVKFHMLGFGMKDLIGKKGNRAHVIIPKNMRILLHDLEFTKKRLNPYQFKGGIGKTSILSFSG